MIDDANIRVTLTVTSIRRASRCPNYHVLTQRIHSRYERRLADVPWGSYQMCWQLRVRKFFCTNKGNPSIALGAIARKTNRSAAGMSSP